MGPRFSANGDANKARITEMKRAADVRRGIPVVEGWYLYCTKNHSCSNRRGDMTA